MTWDFSTEPEFEAKLKWMRSFVDAEILPLETLELDERAFTRIVEPMRAQVKAQGLWAAHLPPSLGGEGFGQVKLALMHEILGRSVYAPTVFGNQAPDSGNAELIALAGSVDQKERWLKPLLAGDIRSGFSMTEPDSAGSDPMLLTTRAVRDGDEWVITGRKWYTSNGSVADILIVMAISNPDVSARDGASMFLVPTDTPGVDIVRDIPTMEDPIADRGQFRAGGFGHAEIVFREVRVPYENLLGKEGEGFMLAQARLGPGRIHHCMRWLGQSQRAFDMLCERALSREAHGGLLAEKQSVQNWIADSAAEMHAARLMTLHAAWMIDQYGARHARTEIGMIKYFGAAVLYNVIDRALQVHGGLGYSTDMPLEAMYRFARAARIYDGPDEVHRVSVARRILRRYEPSDVPSEHILIRREAAIRKFGDLLEQATLQA
jgi:acyl-CoA dehydrogenase